MSPDNNNQNYQEDSDSTNDKSSKRVPLVNRLSIFLIKRLGFDPQAKLWFSVLPILMTGLFIVLISIIPYGINNKGVAHAFSIFFELVIPTLFLMYSMILIVIGVMEKKINSRNELYSASMFLFLTFIFSLFALFANQAYANGNFINTPFSTVYTLSAIVSIIDVYYIFSLIRSIINLMIKEYATESI